MKHRRQSDDRFDVIFNNPPILSCEEMKATPSTVEIKSDCVEKQDCIEDICVRLVKLNNRSSSYKSCLWKNLVGLSALQKLGADNQQTIKVRLLSHVPRWRLLAASSSTSNYL